MEELLEIAASCSYQVDKRTVLPDLPDKVYTQRYCKPTSEQAALFKEIRKNRETLTENGAITAKNVLERMLRLQSVCGGFVNVNTGKLDSRDKPILQPTPVGKANPKINLLVEFLDEFDEPALIWTPYISEIKAIGAVLEKRYGNNNVGYLYGDIDRDARQRYVNSLQRGSIRYIVGNPSTGGIGLTMTAAKAAIYFTNSYNYIDRVQSEDRIHRKGQTDKVLIVDFVMEGTVDEIVMMALKAKSDVSDFIRDNLQLILDNGVI
jgi:SNF2 family DNA or RNA helicase